MHAKITVTDSSTSVLTLLISAFETKPKTKKAFILVHFLWILDLFCNHMIQERGRKVVCTICALQCAYISVFANSNSGLKMEKYCNKCLLNLRTPQFQRRLKMINIFVHFPQTIQKSTIQQNWSYFIFLDLMVQNNDLFRAHTLLCSAGNSIRLK